MLSVIVPAYNEAKNIGPLLETLLEVGTQDLPLHEVIVVDDNSEDETSSVVKRYASQDDRIRLICSRGHKHGMGFALRDGMSAATGELIVWVMADRSDDLGTLRRMVDRIKEGYDVVFASRYMTGGSRGELDPLKAFLSSRYSVAARWMFGLPVHDITNAFRVFRKEVIRKVSLTRGDFGISPELAIKAHLSGYRLAEVPTTYYQRRAGVAKFKILRMMAVYTWLLCNLFIRKAFIRNRHRN